MATPLDETARESTAPTRTLPWWGFGLANVVVLTILAFVSWWLLVDPSWSALHLYPQPFTAMLFWTILGSVWQAFTFGWVGPARLAPPLRGLVSIGIALLIGVGMTLLFGYVYGAVDPTFAASREGGAGFTTGNLIVLFGFFFYVIAAVNWGQWPWAPKTEQPLRGLGEFALLLIPTIVLYAFLVLPNLATWGDPKSALFTIPTLIGWFYSVIVSVVVSGVLLDNWPWRLAGSPGRVVAASIVGNVIVGTGIYYLDLLMAQLLMGPSNVAALGPAVTLHSAEFGVCWVFWMVAWANVFGNWPTQRGLAANYGIRLVVTFVLGILTYPLYYFVLAGPLLHEPVAAGTLHGDALGFMNWGVLWILWYVVFLGSYGIPGVRTEMTEVTAA